MSGAAGWRGLPTASVERGGPVAISSEGRWRISACATGIQRKYRGWSRAQVQEADALGFQRADFPRDIAVESDAGVRSGCPVPSGVETGGCRQAQADGRQEQVNGAW